MINVIITILKKLRAVIIVIYYNIRYGKVKGRVKLYERMEINCQKKHGISLSEYMLRKALGEFNE